jgi:long-chain acyl-CoA synthetase
MNFQALRASTLPGMLVARARARPRRVAFRAKELGIWRETTWDGFAERVAALALGLAGEYRLGRGETMAIIGDPCPEWTIADLAAQALGAITYGIYPTSAPGEVRHLLQHGGASLIVAEDQEHLDKTLEVLDDCPGVRAILVVDTRALFMYRHPRVRPLADVERRGRAALADEPDALGRLARALSPEDPATIIYTSGTTGHPKGAVYRHGPHLAACANIVEHYPILRQGEHRAVAMLPLCHAMGRNLAITMPFLADIVPHYPESVDAFAEALYEIQPTFVFTVPRYLQKFAAHLLVGLDQSARVKRAAYRMAIGLGRRGLSRRHREPGRAGSPALLPALARALVFRWLLEKVGFARVKLVISSGAPLPPAVATLWQAWGVNLCEAYGQTETGGALISGQLGPYPSPGDVGVAAPNMGVELDADGEILVAAADGFGGYWRDTEATQALYRGARLATGDVGEWIAGALKLVDRKKDILITAGGKNVSPSHVENRLRASPYISEAAVFGEGRKYLVALLEADAETVAEWARERGVAHTGYASLVARPEIIGLIDAELRRANDDLARVEQVKAFRLLPRELDPELEGEPVTPTRKVKRRLMAERYGALVESMYAGDEDNRIAAEAARVSTED